MSSIENYTCSTWDRGFDGAFFVWGEKEAVEGQPLLSEGVQGHHWLKAHEVDQCQSSSLLLLLLLSRQEVGRGVAIWWSRPRFRHGPVFMAVMATADGRVARLLLWWIWLMVVISCGRVKGMVRNPLTTRGHGELCLSQVDDEHFAIDWKLEKRLFPERTHLQKAIA